jgi:hypothetical protein
VQVDLGDDVEGGHQPSASSCSSSASNCAVSAS